MREVVAAIGVLVSFGLVGRYINRRAYFKGKPWPKWLRAPGDEP